MISLIILNDGLYSLVPVTQQMMDSIALITEVNFYELCDLLRLKLTEYHTEINVHSMNDGSGLWFGCIGK
tara:strand:- start:858 stop:1067 length:210 start_codon:yes stop_codon:yes gene_type:complete